MRPPVLVTAWLACVLAVAGCEQPQPPEIAVPMPAASLPPPPPLITAPPVSAAPAAFERPPAGRSVQGRPIHCYVHGSGDETVLILGGVHGNEPAGVPLCEQLSAYLESEPVELNGRRVVIAPAVNPDGLAAGRRTNSRGVDLNRNFDTANRQASGRHGQAAMSEPESRFLAGLVERYRPARIVTVHQPLACVDWDGPGQELAAAMARACRLPARKLGAQAGSLGSYAGVDRQVAIVTLELPRSATELSPAGLWRLYGDALLVAIRHDGGAVRLAK